MSKSVIAVIAQGAMGSGVGGLLSSNGVDVVTSLAGRGPASAERAAKVGMRAVNDEQIATADMVLSIVPPAEAMALAERLAPALRSSSRKTIYVDCNAVSSATAIAIGRVVSGTGARYVDAGIIGGPPRAGYCPNLYASGVDTATMQPLIDAGMIVRIVDGPTGAASAMKMAYAGCTKGFTALGAASVLVAERHGATAALRQEMSESQPHLLAFLDRAIPDMFAKAYRFNGEMEQIAEHAEHAAIAEIYRGMAKLYTELAASQAGDKRSIGVLDRFRKG